MKFKSVPFFRPPQQGHRRVRALQGVFLAVFAPLGWLVIRTAMGVSPVGVLERNPGLFAYMLLGTMTVFGLFGWLLGREEERLSKLAMLDELTGLANSRNFGQRLDECIALSRRDGKPLSLLLVDLDRFKSVNDTHGHQAGDMALKGAASVLKTSIRVSDVAARVGGEEFALILPETGPYEAAKVAERILNGLRIALIHTADGARVNLSASIGLACGVPEEGVTAFALYAEADKALYKAKNQGRDRLVSACAYRPDMAPTPDDMA
jgi:diguanylate cyclase (GGDEF)-like protein